MNMIITNLFRYKPSIAKYRKSARCIRIGDGYERLYFNNRSGAVILTKDLQPPEALNFLENLDYIDGQIASNMTKAFQTFEELKKLKLSALIGDGLNAHAFLLSNNRVLKVIKRSGCSSIDNSNIRAPFDTTLEAESSIIGTIDEYTYCLQEFGIPNVRKYGFLKLTKKLKKSGATINDWGRYQCARFTDNRRRLIKNPFGIIKVIDFGCITPPNINNL